VVAIKIVFAISDIKSLLNNADECGENIRFNQMETCVISVFPLKNGFLNSNAKYAKENATRLNAGNNTAPLLPNKQKGADERRWLQYGRECGQPARPERSGV
jgi:hypothetical protein